MRTQWLSRALQRLLPRAIASELFEPASHDARHAYLTRIEQIVAYASTASVARMGRLHATILFWISLLVIYLDCWRLSAALAVRWLWEKAQTLLSETPSLPSTRKPEHAAVITYHLKHAFRRLVREPGFTIAAVLTLAIGVGGNAAVFAVVEAVLLRPLPYSNANDLVIVRHRDTRTSITKEFVALGDYIDMARDQRAFKSFASYGYGSTSITKDAEPQTVHMLLAGSTLLETLGVRPLLGRGITTEDTRPGAAPVVMLSEDLWRQQFGGDPAVIGRSIKVSQTQSTIVGITPSSFRFPPTTQLDIVVPATIPAVAPTERRSGWNFVVARLNPGTTLPAALIDLTSVSARMAREFPQSNLASTYYAVPLREALVGDTQKALKLLLAAVVVVLLIACANVANLLLARSLGRRREMAVKLALGAGRGRLALQLLSESVVLSVVAGIAGVIIAYWGASALVALIPNGDNIPGLADVHINGTVLAFSLGITIATSLIFALVSLLTVHVEDGTGVLVAAGRASMSSAARRATSGLVAIEISLAIMLLIGAGLITRSFTGLLAVNPGFKYDQVATLEVSLPIARFPITVRRAVFQNVFQSLRANPAVRDVGAAAVTPLTGNNWTAPFLRAEAPVAAGEQPPEVGWQAASGGYFTALQIPLIAGRLFNEHDLPDGPPVVIVSEAVQKRFYPNESAVGKQIMQDGRTAEIVGVVGNIRRAGLNDEPRADLYMPFERSSPGSTTLFVHTASDAELAIPVITAALKQIEPGMVVRESRTLASIAGESVRVTRLLLWLLGVFAVTALVLAAVGIYGVMSYVVRQRTREIGTRIALGATRTNILWLVMKQGASIATIGVVVGVGGGLVATRLLASVLYNTSPSDPLTVAIAASVLMVTCMFACYLPARRASSVDPARTLTES